MNSVVFGKSMPPTKRMPNSAVTRVWKNFLIMIICSSNQSQFQTGKANISQFFLVNSTCSGLWQTLMLTWSQEFK